MDKHQIDKNIIEPESTTLTYDRYLKIPELLDLQKPQSSPTQHDETLFIVIHHFRWPAAPADKINVPKQTDNPNRQKKKLKKVPVAKFVWFASSPTELQTRMLVHCGNKVSIAYSI